MLSLWLWSDCKVDAVARRMSRPTYLGRPECQEMMPRGYGPYLGKPWGEGEMIDYSRAAAALQGKGLLLNGDTFQGRQLLLKWTSGPSEADRSSYRGPRAKQDHLILQWYYDLTPQSLPGVAEQFT